MEERSARAKIGLVKKDLVMDSEGSTRSGVVHALPVDSPPSRGIAPGIVLDGRYLVGKIIGTGAFGVVYEAKNLELGEKVALKAMRTEAAIDAQLIARFAREAKAAAAIKSEYVATVYDVGTSPDGMPYIVMEYLDGKNLGQLVDESGPLHPRTVVEYALQICEALAVAHSKGIVHRDIKPENLLLTERDGGMHIVKVLDFGISKAALGGSIFGAELPIVKTMNLMGTPLYMSPEQVRCSDSVDVRSDIWSLGMVLYELIAAQAAFDGSSITEICAAVLEMDPKPIETHRGDLPAGLVDVIRRCLEKDVTRRYQNIAELALALMPFGPKRSRLNVERAVAVLKSTGQVNPNLQVDSVAPPPSTESAPMPSIPKNSVPSGLLGAESATLVASQPPTPRERKKVGTAAAAGAALVVSLVGAGAAIVHRSSSPPAVAPTVVPQTAPTVEARPTPAATVAPQTSSPELPLPTEKPTAAKPSIPSWHPAAPAAYPPKGVRGPTTFPVPSATAQASSAPVAVVPSAPPVPAKPVAAPPAETSTGRTFRRDL